MNVLNSQIQPDATDHSEPRYESSASNLTAEILPACSLLGIIAGFIAFVAFGQAILPAMVAGVIGVLLGLFFACGQKSSQAPLRTRHARK